MKENAVLLMRKLWPIVIVAGLIAGSSSAHPHAVWKDETDWGGGSWGEHVGPPRRGPHFLPGLPSNVSVTVGRVVTLPCQVANLRGRSVSWIRRSDLQVLTTDKNVFTSDDRFQVVARRLSGVWAWDLVISDTTENDDGTYECQINTRPKLSHPVLLQVVQAGAVIAGPNEVYVHTGSRLLLTCWVHAPPKPPGPLVWFHNGTVLDSLTRGGLSLHVAVEGPRASTRLSLLHVTPTDAGNYTCQPEGLDAATVIVFVLQDEAPAAMHHDNGSPRQLQNLDSFIFVLLLSVIFSSYISTSFHTFALQFPMIEKGFWTKIKKAIHERLQFEAFSSVKKFINSTVTKSLSETGFDVDISSLSFMIVCMVSMVTTILNTVTSFEESIRNSSAGQYDETQFQNSSNGKYFMYYLRMKL